MKLKRFYKGLSIISIVFGAVLIINTQITIVGSVIGNNTLSSNSSVLWSIFFMATGIALFYAQSKDSKK